MLAEGDVQRDAMLAKLVEGVIAIGDLNVLSGNGDLLGRGSYFLVFALRRLGG